MTEINFTTGFDKSGQEYGDIQAHGDVRNVLTALLTHFTAVTDKMHTDSHHGTTIRLIDYEFNVKYGQFGPNGKKKLGLIFDGSGHWYNRVNQYGRTEREERGMPVETKDGLLNILKDLLPSNSVVDVWNHNNTCCSFSVVLNVDVDYVEHPHNNKAYEAEIESMVKSLNRLAKSFKALSR